MTSLLIFAVPREQVNGKRKSDDPTSEQDEHCPARIEHWLQTKSHIPPGIHGVSGRQEQGYAV